MPEFTKAQRAALEANLTQAQLRAVETGDLRPIFQDGEFKGTVFVLDQQAAIKVGGPSDDDPPGAAPARTAADVRRDMETAQATGQQSEAIRLSRELQLIEQQGFTPAEAAKAERIERASREIAGRNQEDVDAFEDRSSVEQGPERPTEPPGADAEDKRAEEAAPREYRRQIVVYEAQKGARERLVKKYGTGFDEEGRQLVDLAEAVKSVDPAALLYAGFTQAQIDAALASNEATEQASVGYARAVAARDDLIAQYGLGVDADGRQLVSLNDAVDNMSDAKLLLAGYTQEDLAAARQNKAAFRDANREYVQTAQAWAKPACTWARPLSRLVQGLNSSVSATASPLKLKYLKIH